MTPSPAFLALTISAMALAAFAEDHELIHISEVGTSLSVSTGQGEVHLVTTNNSNSRTEGTVTAFFEINGVAISTQEIGSIQQGESKNVVLPFSGIDPMALIFSGLGRGDLVGTVVLKAGDALLDEAPVLLNPPNAPLELVRYFNELVNDRGFVPVGKTLEDRIKDAQSTLLEINDHEIARFHKSMGFNPWRDWPESRIVGKLVARFNAGPQSDKAKDKYDALAEQLLQAGKKFNNMALVLKSARRKAYERLVKTMVFPD